MKKVSRRNFVIAASTGAVVTGVAVAVPSIVGAQSGQAYQKAQRFASTLQSHLTAYVRNASTGEVVLLTDNKQVVIQDTDLATRLLNAAQ